MHRAARRAIPRAGDSDPDTFGLVNGLPRGPGGLGSDARLDGSGVEESLGASTAAELGETNLYPVTRSRESPSRTGPVPCPRNLGNWETTRRCLGIRHVRRSPQSTQRGPERASSPVLRRRQSRHGAWCTRHA